MGTTEGPNRTNKQVHDLHLHARGSPSTSLLNLHEGPHSSDLNPKPNIKRISCTRFTRMRKTFQNSTNALEKQTCYGHGLVWKNSMNLANLRWSHCARNKEDATLAVGLNEVLYQQHRSDHVVNMQVIRMLLNVDNRDLRLQAPLELCSFVQNTSCTTQNKIKTLSETGLVRNAAPASLANSASCRVKTVPACNQRTRSKKMAKRLSLNCTRGRTTLYKCVWRTWIHEGLETNHCPSTRVEMIASGNIQRNRGCTSKSVIKCGLKFRRLLSRLNCPPKSPPCISSINKASELATIHTPMVADGYSRTSSLTTCKQSVTTPCWT